MGRHRQGYHKEYREKHLEEGKQYAKEYSVRKREKIMCISARARAKESGVPFSITEDDIVIPDKCLVLGIDLVINVGLGKPSDNSPSLDRIVPELGYVPDNVVVISNRANTIKSHGTSEEHRMIADWMDEQT